MIRVIGWALIGVGAILLALQAATGAAAPAEGDLKAWDLVVISGALTAAGIALILRPPSRLSEDEIDKRLGGALQAPIPVVDDMNKESFELAQAALKDEFDKAVLSIDATGGRLAALPPLVAGFGALSLGNIQVAGPLYYPMVAALLATVISALAVAIFAFLGLRTRRFSFGPDPFAVYKYAPRVDLANRKMALRSLAVISNRALETTVRRAWFFNLALEAATVSLLAVLVLRLLGGAEGG